MPWTISYYSERVLTDIRSLPVTLKARYAKLAGIITESGPDIGEPHTKAFGSGLFELRLKGKEGAARVMFCTLVGQQVVMLHCFIKKTQKTPKHELDIAMRRLKEVKRDADT